MTPKGAAAWTLGVALAGAWLASASGVIGQPQPTPRPPARSPLATETEAISFDVEAQAQRLRKRLALAPAPQPVRNPFVFAERRPIQTNRAPRIAAAPPAPVVAVEFEPELTLIGVAEDGTGERLVRTAMIVGAGQQLFMVRVGQAVGARYQVTAISADAVELKDPANDRIRRLRLQ